MIEVRYEHPVSDLEQQGRHPLDFRSLPFDEAVLGLHQTQCLVKTPSATQARQPIYIYKGSLSTRQRYERRLQALIRALGLDLSADAQPGPEP